MKRLILLAAVAFFFAPAAQMRRRRSQLHSGSMRALKRRSRPDEFYLQIINNERDSKGKISVESQQRYAIAALNVPGSMSRNSSRWPTTERVFVRKHLGGHAKYQLQLGSSAMVAKVWWRVLTDWAFRTPDPEGSKLKRTV